VSTGDCISQAPSDPGLPRWKRRFTLREPALRDRALEPESLDDLLSRIPLALAADGGIRVPGYNPSIQAPITSTPARSTSCEPIGGIGFAPRVLIRSKSVLDARLPGATRRSFGRPSGSRQGF
jgi:hypothetical protein